MTAWLVVAGSTLQVVGVCFAALGIHEVRKSWTDRPGISGTLKRRAKTVGRWVRGKLARTFPSLGEHVTVYPGTANATFSVSAKDIGKVSPPPVPADPAGRVGWLIDRVQELWERTDRTSAASEGLAAAWETDRQQMTDEFARLKADVRSKLSELAGGGLRLQAWGVGLLLLGILLTMLGALL
jgi:hypothetical protein